MCPNAPRSPLIADIALERSAGDSAASAPVHRRTGGVESRPAAMLLITQRAEKPEKKKGSDTGATHVCDVEEY